MNKSEIVNNPDFEEITVLKQADIKDFVKRELLNNSGGWATIGNMYQLFGGLLFFLLLTKSTISLVKTSKPDNFVAIGIGLFISFTLIVIIHELIHAVAYKLVGAKKISFGADIKRFIFHVQVDKQVFNYKQMMFVALAPAVVIFITTAIGAIIFSGSVYYIFATILAVHSLFCLGDLGILCFFQNRPDKDIYTFDDKEKKETYFYAKII